MRAAKQMEAQMIDAALGYAAKGLPVFPCNAANKHPLTENGFQDASADPETVKGWWMRWPNAMIGMPTGSQTGFWALDVDDPAAFEEACTIALPATRRNDTAKGYHLFFKWDQASPVTNRQRHPKRGWPMPELPGAETRGEGGYVIMPPSLHPSGRRYEWHDEAPIVEAPRALLNAVRKPPRREQSARNDNAGPVSSSPIGGATAYGLAALEKECAGIRDACEGEQESALNEAALKIGALVAGGELRRDIARAALIEAGLAMFSYNSRDPWERPAIERKIDRGMADGSRKPRSAPKQDGLSLEDFRAYMPTHSYIFMPSGELWPSSSVNSRLPPMPVLGPDGQQRRDEKDKLVFMSPSTWLDQNRPVEQMTWAPGEPPVITDRLISDGGWIPRAGCNVFNLYRPPLAKAGDARNAGPWIEHLQKVYPADAGHIISWLAHRAQRPQEKINHALVLGGSQGIGKDTILEPVKQAIGPWNFQEVSPGNMLGRFNGFVKSVILRVSEARDLGDVDRFAFYDHMKTYTAAPPDVLRVDEKHLREYSVFNVCGVIITTNHKTDGIYLLADDRRHYVAWSDLSRDAFDQDYWSDLYGWYARGGVADVVAYLRGLDLAKFDPKAPPPKTPAFWDIVSSNQAPEDAELADALDALGRPAAVTVARVAEKADTAFAEWLRDRRSSRRLPHRFEECGYVPARNPDAQDGLFKVNGKRCVVYAKREMSVREQVEAARSLIW